MVSSNWFRKGDKVALRELDPSAGSSPATTAIICYGGTIRPGGEGEPPLIEQQRCMYGRQPAGLPVKNRFMKVLNIVIDVMCILSLPVSIALLFYVLKDRRN